MAFDGLGSIGQVALQVGAVAEATAFYRDALGMRFLFETSGMAFFDCGGIRLMVGEPEPGEEAPPGGEDAGGPGASPGTILYFEVGDIEGAHEVLEGRGVEFLQGPRKVAELEDHALWLAFFRDPWGNVLALMSEVAA